MKIKINYIKNNNMLECDKCGYTCKTAKYLLKHKKTAKYCTKYEDIIFVCRKCNFSTKGIKNIEKHSEECTYISNSLSEIVNSKQQVDDKKRVLDIKIIQLETKIRNKDLSIMDLRLRLQFEQMKNKIYSNIIQTQTDIKVENIIQENKDDVHIFNFENGNIPVIVHEFAENNTEKHILSIKENSEIEEYKSKKKKKDSEKDSEIEDETIKQDSEIDDETKERKKIYRTVKEYTKTTEKVLENKLKEDIVRVDKEIDKIVYNNFDVSYKDIKEEIEKLFETLTTSRVYTVTLSSIRKLRKKLLGKLSLIEYTTIVFEHIKRVEDIFTERKCTTKKIIKIVSSSLTPLDMRLTYYKGYTNVNIEHEEVEQFGLALEILIEHKKQFVPYNKNTFFDNIKNYGLSIFELRDCIERCLVNRYGFHNVIHVKRPKSTSKDPYSFYTLATVGDTRCWKMECRLEDFVSHFADISLTYCITLFRKIYFDVFEDNIYRKDYMSKSQITEFDCEQLILNIITLSQPITLCKLFQDIIITKCTITPTEADKFDFYGDDKIQQKRFNTTKDLDENTANVMKRLFNGIDDDDTFNIINSK
jgi:hypothetical protein